MNGNSIITQYWDDKKKAHYLSWDKDPFVKAKVLFIYKEKEARLYAIKERDYVSQKVDGYNIFILAAGFTETPGYEVPDYEVQTIINTMAQWYLKNIIPKWSNLTRNKLKSAPQKQIYE